MSDTTPGNEPEEPRLDDENASEGAVTSDVDAAVARATAEPAEPEPEPAAADASDAADEAEVVANGDTGDVPGPVPAGSITRETYVPAASVAPGVAAGAATLAPEPAAAEPTAAYPSYATPTQQAIYVQAPQPPRAKGNRAFGVLVGLVSSVVFALLYAAAGYILITVQGSTGDPNEVFTQFLAHPAYWVPVIFFFLGFIVLAAIVNRGPWWTYAVFGFFVGLLVYFSYVGGALLGQAWNLTPAEVADFVAQRWLDPRAIIAGVLAREITLWFGGWAAARGAKVTVRNREALEEYDRQLAAGPQFSS